jgi:guanyl-specific ribonuclease Sa
MGSLPSLIPHLSSFIRYGGADRAESTLLAMLPQRLAVWLPTSVTPASTARRINANITAYSTAVAPSSERNSLSRSRMAVLRLRSGQLAALPRPAHNAVSHQAYVGGRDCQTEKGGAKGQTIEG